MHTHLYYWTQGLSLELTPVLLYLSFELFIPYVSHKAAPSRLLPMYVRWFAKTLCEKFSWKADLPGGCSGFHKGGCGCVIQKELLLTLSPTSVNDSRTPSGKLRSPDSKMPLLSCSPILSKICSMCIQMTGRRWWWGKSTKTLSWSIIWIMARGS